MSAPRAYQDDGGPVSDEMHNVIVREIFGTADGPVRFDSIREEDKAGGVSLFVDDDISVTIGRDTGGWGFVFEGKPHLMLARSRGPCSSLNDWSA